MWLRVCDDRRVVVTIGDEDRHVGRRGQLRHLAHRLGQRRRDVQVPASAVDPDPDLLTGLPRGDLGLRQGPRGAARPDVFWLLVAYQRKSVQGMAFARKTQGGA